MKLWGAFVACAVVVSTLVHWPVMHSGYLIDDYLQLAMLDGTYPVRRSPLELYSFVRSAPELSTLIASGTMPWWSHPDFRLSPLRPLSSLTLAIDYWLGLSPFAKHLHSELWWVGLLLAFSRLARKLLPAAPAACAVLLFALDPARLVPIAWLANRTALVSALFGVLAFTEHWRWREEGAPRGALVSGACWALALLGGEYAISALCFPLAYELVGRTGPWRARMRALVPSALALFAYGVAYLGLGFGMAANWLYVTPLSAPVVFLRSALSRVPALLSNDLLLVPAEFTEALLSTRYAEITKLVVPLLIVGWLLWGAIRRSVQPARRVLIFLAAALLASLLPMLATISTTRLLLTPSVASSLLIGAVLWDAIERLRALPEATLARLSLAARLVGVTLLAVIHLLLAPWFTWTLARGTVTLREAYRDACLKAPIDDARVGAQNVVLINGRDVLTAFYLPRVRHADGRPLPHGFHVLALSMQPVHVKRVAADVLELEVARGSLLDHPHVLASRPGDVAFVPNQSVEAGSLRIEIVTVGPFGPTRIRYRFAEPLDSPALRFLTATSTGFAAFIPPAFGAEVVVKFD